MKDNTGVEMVVIRRVYERSSTAEHLEIVQDGDGLGFVELRFKEDLFKTITSVSFTPDAAPFVAHAILELAKEIKAKEAK